MKHSRDPDENCYPFIYEAGALCDFEVFTDELCGHLGAALSLLEVSAWSPNLDDPPEHQRRLIEMLSESMNGSHRIATNWTTANAWPS